jgi:hypothetical protein
MVHPPSRPVSELDMTFFSLEFEGSSAHLDKIQCSKKSVFQLHLITAGILFKPRPGEAKISLLIPPFSDAIPLAVFKIQIRFRNFEKLCAFSTYCHWCLLLT